MEFWHDLKKFKTGRTPEGHDLLSIPLPPDEEGMVGRECPRNDCQPRYFKISSSVEESKAVPKQEKKKVIKYLFCPYCGHRDWLNRFATHDQTEWVKSMMVRDVHKTINNMFRNKFGAHGTTHGGGLLSIRLEYKGGILPSVRHYAEKELTRKIECDQCGGRYSVYGIAMYCPWCGEGNIGVHLGRSVGIIKGLMEARDQVVKKAGKEAGHHLLGNCLEDCVSLFEGFLKIIYKNQVQKTYDKQVCLRKLKRLRNSFQRLSKAEEIFKRDLRKDLFLGISKEERELMELQFAKRHVITHNLGLIDEKFKTQVATWQTAGQDIDLGASGVEHLLSLTQRVIRNALA